MPNWAEKFDQLAEQVRGAVIPACLVLSCSNLVVLVLVLAVLSVGGCGRRYRVWRHDKQDSRSSSCWFKHRGGGPTGQQGSSSHASPG